MLRIIVISLFVANLLLLGFQGSRPAAGPETTTSQEVTQDSNIPKLYLFGELARDQELMTGNRQCYSLGPFHTIEGMEEVQGRLEVVASSIDERQTQAFVEKGYWVYLPPYTSLLEANQVLLSLKALGLKDVGIIYTGEMKNSISLGYFLRQENAQRRKRGLEERGYEPLMRVQRQNEVRYWLDYEQMPGAELVSLDMQNLPNDFMQRAMPCPAIDLIDDATAELQPVSESGPEQG
jgi:hypothetical protein